MILPKGIVNSNSTDNIISSLSQPFIANGASFVCASSLSVMLLLWTFLKKEENNKISPRVVTLPGYGILGDKVNELLELFLDALAVYVHK